MTDIKSKLRAMYLARNEAFLSEVDHEHVDQVICDLIKLAHNQTEVTLVISSPGGVTDAGFRLAQFIEQELSVPVIGRVWDQCSSASTYALLCCAKRSAHPQATFVLHRQTSSIEMEYTDDFKKRVDEWVADNAAIHSRQVDFYSRKLQLPQNKVEEILVRGTGVNSQLSATEALEIGLINSITFSDQ